MNDAPAWIQAVAALTVPAVAGLVAWARGLANESAKLRLDNAELTGRVKALEDARAEDLGAIRKIAEGQTAILCKLEAVVTELRITRGFDDSAKR